MEHKVLHAEVRTLKGKAGSKQVRKSGKIPAIVYGHKEPITVSIDDKEFHKNFKHVSESTIIDLMIGSDSRKVLVKDFQDSILTGKIGHIDFYEVDTTKVLRTHVPVHFTGNPVGVKEGGVMEGVNHEIEVECLPKDLPESITVDTTALKIGDCIYVRDIIATYPNIKILSSGEVVLVHVVHMRENVIAAPVAAVAEVAPAAPAAGATVSAPGAAPAAAKKA